MCKEGSRINTHEQNEWIANVYQIKLHSCIVLDSRLHGENLGGNAFKKVLILITILF